MVSYGLGVCALAGEVGEACNLIKKLRRLDGKKKVANTPEDPGEIIADIGKELANAVAYLDLLAARLGLDDLGELYRDKFNEVSERNNCDIRL